MLAPLPCRFAITALIGHRRHTLATLAILTFPSPATYRHPGAPCLLRCARLARPTGPRNVASRGRNKPRRSRDQEVIRSCLPVLAAVGIPTPPRVYRCRIQYPFLDSQFRMRRWYGAAQKVPPGRTSAVAGEPVVRRLLVTGDRAVRQRRGATTTGVRRSLDQPIEGLLSVPAE